MQRVLLLLLFVSWVLILCFISSAVFPKMVVCTVYEKGNWKAARGTVVKNCMDIIRKHWFCFSEGFWLDCLEIEVIPLANHKLHWRLNEPIITQTEDAQMLSLWEHLRERHSWFVLPELLLFLARIFKQNTYRRKTQRFQRRMKLSFLSYNQRHKKYKGPDNFEKKKKTYNLSHARDIKTSSMKVRENWWSVMLVSEWIRKRPFLILTCSRNFYNLNVLN